VELQEQQCSCVRIRFSLLRGSPIMAVPVILPRQVLDTPGGPHDAHMHAVSLLELRIEIRPASIHRRQI
jgi:hypothetical protein